MLLEYSAIIHVDKIRLPTFGAFQLYRKLAVSMGYDECHLFLRFVQFEFAAFNETAGKPPPVFITAVNEDDSINLDRYVPNQLYLAIHEVDESHVGRFSFRNRDGVKQVH